jgi:hypothetical protein
MTKSLPDTKELKAALQRFIDGHFGNRGHDGRSNSPRISIPAREDYDDDLVLAAALDRLALGERAISLLVNHEWPGDAICPECNASEYTAKGHKPGCEWDAIVKEAKARP